MKKTISNFVLLAALFVVAGASFSSKARAGEGYCREYTRTVYIGVSVQNAYGTACLQADGSWMIVGERPEDDVYDRSRYVIHESRHDIIPPRVIYYSQPEIRVFRTRSFVPAFRWRQEDRHDRGRHYGHRHWRAERGDRDHDRHRGRD